MKFQYPVHQTSQITQTFAEHEQARAEMLRASPGKTIYYNGGIDFAVVMGSLVRSAAYGKVSRAQYKLDGYGRVVYIDHDDNYTSIYAHLTEFACRVGQIVKAGDVIGYSGSSGNSTGPHLHFELRLLGKPIDPAPLLQTSLEDTQDETSDVTAVPVPIGIATVISESGLRIRNAPSIMANQIGSLPCGVRVVYIKRMSDDDTSEWLKIGNEAWIASSRFMGDHLVVLETIQQGLSK